MERKGRVRRLFSASPRGLERKLFAACTAGLVIYSLLNAPFPLPQQFRAGTQKTIRATLIAFGKDASEASVRSRAKEPKVFLKSLRTKLFEKRAYALTKRLLRFRWIELPYEPGRFIPNSMQQFGHEAMLGHELHHYFTGLSNNAYFISHAYGAYLWNHAKWEASSIAPASPYKMLEVKREGKWWRARVSTGKIEYDIERLDTGLFASRKDYAEFIGIGNLKVEPYAKKEAIAKVDRWKKAHDDPNSELVNNALELGKHAYLLDLGLNSPGLGSTVLRLVGNGVPLHEAEWQAVNGTHREREKRFYREITAARKAFGQYGSYSKPSKPGIGRE